jgi:putative hydrolase of the HAD superfamily
VSAAGPALDAVLLDYGDTIIEVRWDETTLIEGERVLLEALPAPGVPLEGFHDRAARLLEQAGLDAADHAEVDYERVLRTALESFGVRPEAGDLRAAMRAQIMSWNRVRHMHPDAFEMLDGLRRRGLRIGIVTNTLDPPEIVEEVIALEGVAARVDAIVSSTGVGVRKPSPVIYRTALDAVGAAAARTLFVGDRVLEDVVGPGREGMRAALATWFRSDLGDHAQAAFVLERPLELLEVVDRLRLGD